MNRLFRQRDGWHWQSWICFGPSLGRSLRKLSCATMTSTLSRVTSSTNSVRPVQSVRLLGMFDYDLTSTRITNSLLTKSLKKALIPVPPFYSHCPTSRLEEPFIYLFKSYSPNSTSWCSHSKYRWLIMTQTTSESNSDRFIMANAKAAAKAALKGKNNLRKKKVRTTVHFKRPKTLRLAR